MKTIDKIRAFKDPKTPVGYFNDGYDNITETIVTITLSTETVQRLQQNNSVFEQFETVESETKMKKWSMNLRKKVRKMSRYYKKGQMLNNHPNKMKAIKMVLLVTACFVGTWGPYYVAIIVYVKCDILIHGYECIPLEILTLGPLYFLGVCNSLCDPIIYAWWHSGFKHSVRKIYINYFCKFIKFNGMKRDI